VIFYGTDYPDIAAFMRIQMCGLRLWGVLSDDVSCPPCPIAPTAPTPSTPPVLAADATQVDKDVAKSADDTAIDAYDQKVHEYSVALETYRLDLIAYTQWIDDDSRVVAVLTSSVLP
jgi:hypothetical protein